MEKLLIWGTGNLAKRFMYNEYHGEIIGFVETNKSKDTYMGYPVYDSRNLPEEYGYIVAANSYAAEIYSWCLELKIDISKVIFLYGIKQRQGCTDLRILKEILMEKNYSAYCAEFGLIEESFIIADAECYRALNQRPSFAFDERNLCPVISDKYAQAGTISNYFWQDLWAARLVIGSGAKSHFDIGSRLDGFIAHLLAAGIDVTMIDIREFPGEVEHLRTVVDDATTLHQIPDGSIESMSAFCSLEHFGLGRYGDPIDPEACFKCFANIQRKLKKGGRLYISLPVGREKLEFNAHRVFYASTVIQCFDRLTLSEYACTSQGKIEYAPDIHKYDEDPHNGEYRYGMFCFVK